MLPQAVTQRDMIEAFNWLQTLAPSVREELTSLDQVVSHYLRSKRLGTPVPSAEELQARKETQSKSSLDFKNSLKSLQMELDQFELPQQKSTPTSNRQSQQPAANQISSQSTPNGTAKFQMNPENQYIGNPQMDFAEPQSPQAVTFDARSRQLVQEIKDSLNLSSDSEVIRMCIVLAHRELKKLL